MRIIVLAAGQGTRLRPLTNYIPKCLVKYKNKSLIDYQLDLFGQNNITDINVVLGYRADAFDKSEANIIINENYAHTNMVGTLMVAKDLFDGTDDILITYGDIIYTNEVLSSALNNMDDLAITVDLNWLQLWSLRMDNPLEDAETLKINQQGNVFELGKKTNCYDDIQGQYMGLIKVSKHFASSFIKHYEQMDQHSLYDGQSYKNMYMTSYLQSLINEGYLLKALPVFGGWLEIDSIQDIEFYEKYEFPLH